MKPLPRDIEGKPTGAPDDVRAMFAQHFVLPGHEVACARVRRHETIQRFLNRTGWQFKLPTICVVNGQPVLRKDWKKKKIKASDKVTFLSKPWGGGGNSGVGKQVLGLVALIALTAVAGPLATAVLGSELAGTALLGTLTVGKLVAAGIVIGGTLLVNSLISPKKGGQNDNAFPAADPIYSISASGNVGKPLQPLPVAYGRLKTFPDFAATPWSEFVDNDQFINLLLCLGCGKFEKHKLYVEDTEIWDEITGLNSEYEGITYQFCDPGDPVTLFPANVTQAVEVSGQELPDPTTDPNQGWVGGFVANASGTLATDLCLDLVFPSGLWGETQSGGTMYAVGAFIEAEYRPVDAAGTPTGPYVSLYNDEITACSRTPQRRSIKVSVTPGRYEVRLRQNTPIFNGQAPNGDSATNVAVWGGLRAYLKGSSTYDNVSVVAIRAKATAQLSTASSRKFGVLWTRILPVFNSAYGDWVEEATQNPYWAFYDAATNTDYGAGRPASKIDFQNILDGAAAAYLRGDAFNFVFNQNVSVPEAFDTVLKSARARHRWSGDIITTVRDEWRPVPEMLLTDREIIRGSLQFDWIFNTEDSADCVIIEYLDEGTWLPAEVQYPPDSDSFTATNPARARLDGVTNRDHAYRECAFMWLQSQKRRVNVTLDTEHDGRRLSFGSAVRVQSELPQSWGATGVVAARSGVNLTLDPAPDWSEVGQHYIGIRTKQGRLFGPVKCSQGGSASIAVLNTADLAATEAGGVTLTDALDREDGADDPSFAMGVASTWSKPCVVLTGRPSGDKVTVTLFVDDASVHDDDLGVTPAAPLSPNLVDPKVPQITGLNASFQQNVATPLLSASWNPSAGAVYYVAQVSYDAGDSWNPVYEGRDAQFSRTVSYADVRLRVRAVGEKAGGAWVSVDIDAPTISIEQVVLAPDIQEKLDSVSSDLTEVLALARASAQPIEIERLSLSITDLISQVMYDRDQIRLDHSSARQQLSVNIDTNTTAIQTEQTVRQSADDSLAQSVTAISATVTSNYTTLNAAIVTEQTTRATADSALSDSVTSLTSTVTNNYNTLSAAVTTEATTRASADSAISSTVTSLSSTVTNNYNTLNSAITTEQTTRADADTTISASVTSLSSTVTNNYNTLNSAITSESATRASADSAMATSITTLQSTVNGASATVTVTIASPAVVSWTSHGLVAGRRVKFTTTGALPTGITAGTFYYIISAGLTTNAFEISADPEGAAINTSGTQSGTHTATVEAVTATIANEAITRASQDTSLASSITALSATVSTNTAAIATEATARASGDSANASSITVLQSTVNGAAATVTITIASPAVITWNSHGLVAGRRVAFTTTGALPTGITSGTYYYVISTGLATNTFRISTDPEGSAVNTSGSQSGTHTATVEAVTSSLANESITRASQDSTLSGSITSLSSTVSGNYTTLNAAITSEAATRASADTALSSRSDALEASVNGSSATVTITIASPGVVSWTAHGFAAGRRVKFTTTGAIPTGLTAGTYYYILSSGLTTNAFQVSATPTGSAINTSGTQSGTHTGTAETLTATVSTEAVARATQDDAITSTVTSLSSTVSSNTAAISSEATTRASADSALSGRSDVLESSVNGAAATVTITIASPGVVTWNSHGLTAGRRVKFTTTGALPTGITAGTFYYVLSPATNTFQIAAAATGSAINTSGSQSGTHTATVEAVGATLAIEAVTRATQDDALSASLTSLSSTVSTNTAAISSEATTRASADTALSSRSDTLEATVNGTSASHTVTVTIASPAVFTWTSHGLKAGQAVKFTTTGALPTGITAGLTYYVISAGLATNTFEISATFGGSAVNTSGSQSGTHTATTVNLISGLDSISASQTLTAVASAGSDGALSVVDWQVSAKAGGATSSAGLQMAAYADPAGNLYSRIRFSATQFQIQIPGVTGGDPVTPYAVQAVNGVQAVSLQSSAFADNSIPVRALTTGALGKYAYTDPGTVTDTMTNFYNSGSGKVVATLNAAVATGNALKISFNAVPELTVETESSPFVGFGVVPTGTFILKVDGSTVKTWRCAVAVWGSGESALKWFNGSPFSFNRLVTGISPGTHTVQVLFELSPNGGGTSFSVRDPYLYAEELQGTQIIDGTTAVTPSVAHVTSVDYAGTWQTHTFSAVSIGAADSFRNVELEMSYACLYEVAPQVTIGGVTARVVTAFGINGNLVAMVCARVPTGTTADIVVTFAANVSSFQMEVHRIIAFNDQPVSWTWNRVQGLAGGGLAVSMTTKVGQVMTVAVGADYTFSALTGAWGGSDTVTEDLDHGSSDTYAERIGGYHLTLTQATTQNFTVNGTYTGPGNLGFIAALWQ